MPDDSLKPGKVYRPKLDNPIPVPAPSDFIPAQEGKKDDNDKLRTDLLPVTVLEEVSKVYTFGAKKYGDRNWEAGISYSRVYAACLRHLFAWWRKEARDKETGINHLAHAICCLMFLLQYEQFPDKYSQFDTRPELWK